jgi:hypothetical protein
MSKGIYAIVRESRKGDEMRRILLGITLIILAATCFGFEQRAGQSPATNNSGSEPVIQRLAGVWKEDLSKRKTGAAPRLRFRRSATGGLEEIRGPEARPEIQPVILDGRSYPITGSSYSIAWKEIDAGRFERELFGEGRKLISTRRLRLSSDGNTLAEESERARDGARTTASYRRVDGDTHGLAGTWVRESIQGQVAAEMTIERVKGNAMKVSANWSSPFTVRPGGPPVPFTGEGMMSRLTVQARQIDESSIELSSARDGTVYSKSVLRVSADGKTVTTTVIQSGSDGPRGEPTTYVYHRQ